MSLQTMHSRDVSNTSSCPVPQEVKPPSLKVTHGPLQCRFLNIGHIVTRWCDAGNSMLYAGEWCETCN